MFPLPLTPELETVSFLLSEAARKLALVGPTERTALLAVHAVDFRQLALSAGLGLDEAQEFGERCADAIRDAAALTSPEALPQPR